MADRPEPSEIQANLCGLAERIASEHFDTELDYSVDSVQQVERILGAFHDDYRKTQSDDGLDGVALAPEDLAEQIAGDPIVLGHQHARWRGHARAPAARGRDSATGGPCRGNRMKKVEPLPASLSTEIAPPSAAVSWRQIARPRPVPLPRPLVV